MSTKSEEFFHDRWLGMVQSDSDGLVVAKPILLEAGCANHQRPEIQEKLRENCAQKPEEEGMYIADLMQFFQDLLDLDDSLFDSLSTIPDDVSLYAPEGLQTIRPTYGLLKQDKNDYLEGSEPPAARAAAKYKALIWDVTEIDGEVNGEAIGLPLDKPETTTGGWSYPAAAKFDRLLRHCRVPVGILTNREVIRLVYAPHGESSGHITFRIDDMATVGGRPILDAMIMLLCANQWFGVSDENALPSLLRRSREYQGTVTEDLAEQVFSGLETLLKGFQTAAERDRSGLLRVALERDEDHLYRGLLTVMLRMVFILYAEDRNLLPVDHQLYAKQMSLLGLFDRLQRDHGNFPDSMNNRFGAWGHIISLCRAIYLGVEHDDFHIPPRQGDLFDPHRYPFLEGWTGESAPIVTQKARSEVKVPTVDDGTVFTLLRSLLIFQGQRLSYRTLDVEQIGSVYEALMGYQVRVCDSPSVALKINGKRGAAKYWVAPEAVLVHAASQRVKWLKDECGFDKPVATKIKKALDDVGEIEGEDQNTAFEALLPLATGKKMNAHEQLASSGQYVLQPGPERRRTGTQYTPRSLTEPIVRKTLEPLVRCLGQEPTADQILELKVCDPAMGSGAFLVECCRQLADEVVAAWGRAHEVEEIAADCPEGDVVAHARRLVAQRCLYGVDKNAMAVQLAKLSLWLFTLARELPFTFLDHSFRYGDSLVGLDLEQITAFHWKPEKQHSFLGLEIKRALEEVVSIRQEIHQLAGDESPQAQNLKTQKLFDANDATEKVRQIADACVGAFFARSKDKDRLAERLIREHQVRAWLEGSNEAAEAIRKWVIEIRDQHAPFHWWLEFPEVFFKERQDPLVRDGVQSIAYMDALVGNPPFAGTPAISAAYGPSYYQWLTTTNPGDTGSRGKCDLCAFFLRRACSLLGDNGCVGLIATNSISQGETRAIGLKHLLGEGMIIHNARPNMNWPGQAAVTISVVGLAKGEPSNVATVSFQGYAVDSINSRLRPRPERTDPLPLPDNKGTAFKGSDAYGTGFVLTPEEQRALVNSNAANNEVIFPFLGGSEVNTSPSQSYDRFVIDFGNLSLEDAEHWPDLIRIVREKVKPGREQLKENSSTIKSIKRSWWKHGFPRVDSYKALRKMERCLVTAVVSKHVMFSFQPTNRVFSDKLYAFPLDSYAAFGILQSRVHEVWAWLHSSTMRNAGINYSATTCFFTFPFPQGDPKLPVADIAEPGRILHETRSKFMLDSELGLTQTYNALKDPENADFLVLELRRLHEELDRAVLDSYGWSDINVPPFCPTNNEQGIAVESFNDEILDRLYLLNAVRAQNTQQQKLKTEPGRNSKTKFPLNNEPGSNLTLPGLDDR